MPRPALFVAALILTSAASLPAQPAPGPTPPSATERMAPLLALAGEWRGVGWMLLPNGQRETFESRETVTVRLSGAALLVEGRHWRPGSPDRLVHDALAILHWDSRANAYRFRSALANGTGGDFPLEVGDNRFTWRMDLPGGRIEFATEFGGGVWRERGRRQLAEGRWVDFFEMNLTRAQ